MHIHAHGTCGRHRVVALLRIAKPTLAGEAETLTGWVRHHCASPSGQGNPTASKNAKRNAGRTFRTKLLETSRPA